VPAALAAAAVHGALEFVAGATHAATGARAAVLAQGALRTMFATKLKAAALGACVLGVLAVGTVLLARPAPAGKARAVLPGEAVPVAFRGPNPPQAADGGPLLAARKTRQEFSRAMAQVKDCMPEKDVLHLLGRPDDIRTQFDPGGISTTQTREVWCYGTQGHLTFPTLGCVYIDTGGKAQYVYGGQGEPPDSHVVSEEQLCTLLRLIDRVPSYNSAHRFDPLAVIRAVNALQPLGKDKALTVIDEYLRVASHFHSAAREGLFLVLRVLFEVPEDTGHMPHMFVGATPTPKDPKSLPRFPILLVEDIPLLLTGGYALGGRAERAESHVAFFRQHGTLRPRPLAPSADPLRTLEAAQKAFRLVHHDDPDGWNAAWGKELIINQLLNLVASVYQVPADRHGYRFQGGKDSDQRWRRIVADVTRLDIRWDAATGRYTFRDGRALPEPAAKYYRRALWTLDGLKGEVTVVVERSDARYVDVSLRLSLQDGAKFGPAVLGVVALKDKNQSPGRFDVRGLEAAPGGSVGSVQSWTVEVGEGEPLQVEFTQGEEKRLSPVFTP
jgi:hypothetical protein